MKRPEAAVRKFMARGTFLSLRALLHDIGSRQPGAGQGRALPGFVAPAVAFESADGRVEEISIRTVDLPFLYQDDAAQAREYLGTILRARAGGEAAQKKLDAVAARRYAVYRERLKRVTAAEGPYLVPSITEAEHGIDSVSHKGSILLRLCRLGYPVPDFVILTAQAYTEGKGVFERELGRALGALEDLTGRCLEADHDPLVFAMRCAMPNYYPGVMPTYLNVGVTEKAVPGLKKFLGPEAGDRMYLNNLRNLLMFADPGAYESLKHRFRPQYDGAELADMVGRVSGIVRRADPKLLDDVYYQVGYIAQQGLRYYEENGDLLLTLSRGKKQYPALILQKMVCTVRHPEACAGMLFSRHSRLGSGQELLTARNIFGEEIMTGKTPTDETVFKDRSEIRGTFPAVYHFTPHLVELEREFQSALAIEFAVEATDRHQVFALLQLNTAALTGRAALISAADMHQAGIISKRRVTDLIAPCHIKQIESDTIDSVSIGELEHFCSGVPVLARAAVSARIYFSAEAALEAKRRGEKVCFCKNCFEPTDTVVMQEMEGILSLTSAAIHVVTICQGFGTPSLLNLERAGVRLTGDGLVNSAGSVIREGDWVTISSRRMALFKGMAKFRSARLLQYMRGETVVFESADEEEAFRAMAYAYRYYQQLVRNLRVDQIGTLQEVIRLVNLDLRGEVREATDLVNGWFDSHEPQYVQDVLRSEMGDHLDQHRVFDLLSLDRRIRFFKMALAKCAKDRLSGYNAGAFMLGRFLSLAQPMAFWKPFAPPQLALMANEWLLFDKYMQIIFDVGERQVNRARKQILTEGLGEIGLEPRMMRPLMTLKLGRPDWDAVSAALPEWADPQTAKVVEALRAPYGTFFDFSQPWSVAELEKACKAEGLTLPKPEDS
ncbi:MAG: hypothetical protein HY924_12610 [Elusimicrobia bacterium]|nr:hypothetical protein [Elusimicrobiota bacterium]